MTIFDYLRKTIRLGGLALTLLPTAAAQAADSAGTLPGGALLPLALLICAALAGLGWRLYHGLAKPLTDLAQCTRQMADGNLQALVSQETLAGRLSGRIGENVNELALNLQEVLLLVWNLSRQDLEVLERAVNLAEAVEDSDKRRRLASELAFIRHDLEEMQNIVRQFEFYNVVLQEEKLLAKPEPATSQD